MATHPSGKKPAPQKATPKAATPTKPAASNKAVGVRAPDWERIELDYRAGIKSLREIADGSGVSHVTVNKRAKANGWTRDLSQKIQAKADDLVNRAMVNRPVYTASAVSEKETIDFNAQAVADVKITHRKDIGRARRLTIALLDELEKQTDPETLSQLHELGELLRNENEQGQDKRNDLYMKVISLSERSKTMKTLAESLQKTVDMERQAFSMDAKGADNNNPNGPGYLPPSIAVSFVRPPPRVEEDDE